MRVTNNFVFFFTDKDVFSNWYIAPFVDDAACAYNPNVKGSVQFSCVEQYMMWRKACLFRNYDLALAILDKRYQREDEKDQAYYKRMGRSVKNYENSEWLRWREAVVKRGLFMKYSQNTDLKEQLMTHVGKMFVEASPYDAIYGIKMGMWQDGVEDYNNWKGENLLGKWHTDLMNYWNKGSDIM